MAGGYLGMHWTWAASRAPERWQKRIGDSSIDIGNAILSRWPIAEYDVVQLPAGQGDDDGRLALYARIETPTHQVPFFTAHLTSAIDASEVRCRQVAVFAGFVAAHSGGTDFPPVVTGDFNAWPDSDEVRQFGGYKTAPAIPGQVFLDAWEYAGPAQPSATWSPANPYVAAGFDPSVRIDYIHIGRGRGGLGSVSSVRRVAMSLSMVSGRPTTPLSSQTSEFPRTCRFRQRRLSRRRRFRSSGAGWPRAWCGSAHR